MVRGLGVMLVVGLAGSAVAEVRPSDINRPAGEDGLGPGYGGNQTQWALELVGAFGAGTDVQGRALDRLNLAPTIRIATPERRNDVELVWAVLSQRQSFDDNGQTRQELLVSNLHLGYHWAWRTLKRQMRLGLAATLPAATLSSDTADEVAESLDAYTFSRAMRGWRELWLWTPETVTFTGHADLYLRRASGIIIGGQLVTGWMQRVSDSEALAEQELVVQADLEFIYDFEPVRLMLRASMVALPLTEADDLLQASAEPEARFRLGPIDLVTRLSLPLHAPSGPAFSDGGAFALHVGVASATIPVLPEE